MGAGSERDVRDPRSAIVPVIYGYDIISFVAFGLTSDDDTSIKGAASIVVILHRLSRSVVSEYDQQGRQPAVGSPSTT